MRQPILASIVLSLALPFATEPARAIETNDLVGRWGVAAYFDEKDAAATHASAAAACGHPYTISRSKTGHPVMYAAFSGKPVEVSLQGDQIVNAEGDDPLNTKRVIAADASSMVLRYVSGEAAQRYGTMIFVRCRK